MSEILGSPPARWTFVSGVDESESYEVDITEIWDDGEKWHLLTATGCSCWAGEYDEEEYDSLDELARQIGVEDEAREWATS